jgi:hypothetical protein
MRAEQTHPLPDGRGSEGGCAIRFLTGAVLNAGAPFRFLTGAVLNAYACSPTCQRKKASMVALPPTMSLTFFDSSLMKGCSSSATSS